MPKSFHVYLLRFRYLWCIFALFAQLFLQQIFFSYTGSDRNLQLLAAKNLYESSSLSLSQADTSDLSQKTYRALIEWPPAYSVGIIPIYALVKNWMYSERIMGIIALILIFLSMHLIWQLIAPKALYSYMGFFFFWGISFTPFHYTGTSDEWALACLLMGAYLFVRADKSKLIALGLAFFLISMSVCFRYAYLPVLWMFVLIILYRDWKDSQYFSPSFVISLLICAFFTIAIFFFQSPATAGGRALMQGPERLYIENWKLWDAFPLKALAYVSITGIIHTFEVSAGTIIGLRIGFIIISGLVSVVCASYLLPYLREFAMRKNLSARHWGAALWVGVLLSTVGLLAALSLLHPVEIHDGSFRWTYVMETRYYVAVLIGIQMVLWLIPFKLSLKKHIRYVAICLLLGGGIFSTFHTGFRYYQLFVLKHAKETLASAANQKMAWIADYVSKEVSEGNHVLFIHGHSIQTSDEGSVAALAGANQLIFSDLKDELITSVKLEVLISLTDQEWEIWRKRSLGKAISRRACMLFQTVAGDVYGFRFEKEKN